MSYFYTEKNVVPYYTHAGSPEQMEVDEYNIKPGEGREKNPMNLKKDELSERDTLLTQRQLEQQPSLNMLPPQFRFTTQCSVGGFSTQTGPRSSFGGAPNTYGYSFENGDYSPFGGCSCSINDSTNIGNNDSSFDFDRSSTTVSPQYHHHYKNNGYNNHSNCNRGQYCNSDFLSQKTETYSTANISYQYQQHLNKQCNEEHNHNTKIPPAESNYNFYSAADTVAQNIYDQSNCNLSITLSSGSIKHEKKNLVANNNNNQRKKEKENNNLLQKLEKEEELQKKKGCRSDNINKSRVEPEHKRKKGRSLLSAGAGKNTSIDNCAEEDNCTDLSVLSQVTTQKTFARLFSSKETNSQLKRVEKDNRPRENILDPSNSSSGESLQQQHQYCHNNYSEIQHYNYQYNKPIRVSKKIVQESLLDTTSTDHREIFTTRKNNNMSGFFSRKTQSTSSIIPLFFFLAYIFYSSFFYLYIIINCVLHFRKDATR